MIQVITRAIDILEFVAQNGKEPVQLIKIAENVGLSQPTTANILKTLTNRNYLEQVGRKVGYRMGPAAFQLTGNQSYDYGLVEASKQPLTELTRHINETSLVGVIRNNKRHVIHLVESNQMLHVKTTMIADVYGTSTGRLLMAYLTSRELQSLLKSIGLPKKDEWPGCQSREDLEKALEKIREDGYVKIVSRYHTIGFAVPLYNGKAVLASLSVFVPASRYQPTDKDNILKQLNKAAKKIKNNLEALHETRTVTAAQ